MIAAQRRMVVEIVVDQTAEPGAGQTDRSFADVSALGR